MIQGHALTGVELLKNCIYGDFSFPLNLLDIMPSMCENSAKSHELNSFEVVETDKKFRQSNSIESGKGIRYWHNSWSTVPPSRWTHSIPLATNIKCLEPQSNCIWLMPTGHTEKYGHSINWWFLSSLKPPCSSQNRHSPLQTIEKMFVKFEWCMLDKK